MLTLQARALGASTWTTLPVPPPDGITVQICDVDASTTGRDNTGYIHRDKIGMKRKINLSYKYIWDNDVATIVSFANQTFFELKLYDDLTNTTWSGTVYAGDRSGTIYTHALHASKTLYSSFTVNFIER